MVTEGLLHDLVAKFFLPGSIYNRVPGVGEGEDQHPKTLFFLSQSECFHLPCLIVGDTASLF